jgi:hypothetical protein
MRRFAMPAFVLAGLLSLPAPAARADTVLCVGVTVVINGQGQTIVPGQCEDTHVVPLACTTDQVFVLSSAVVVVVVCTLAP